jgi:DNA helicase HerA-like ATPase
MDDRQADGPADGRRADVGRVLGSEDATPMAFRVGVAEGQWLQLDDVVVTERVLPDGQVVHVSGLVTEIRAVHEGARFGSDVFLIADGVLPAQTFEAADIMTSRVEPETYVPPLPGTLVRRAIGAEREMALHFDQMAAKLPIGLGRDGDAVFANVEFLDGTRGAHVNISGISGVATKTSYATFLLYSLFRSGVLGAEAANTKALVFNVKGEDLLFLDQPNTRLQVDDLARYARLGLPAEAFPNVAGRSFCATSSTSAARPMNEVSSGTRLWPSAGMARTENGSSRRWSAPRTAASRTGRSKSRKRKDPIGS